MPAEKFTQECHFCGILINLEWDNGLLPGDFILIADCVYHPHCWDALIAMYPPGDSDDLEDFEWLRPM